MPVEVGVWRIDGNARQVMPARMAREERLESIL
jgi:hypothetical protein